MRGLFACLALPFVACGEPIQSAEEQGAGTLSFQEMAAANMDEAERRGCLPTSYGDDPDFICRLPTDDVTEERAHAALGDRSLAIVPEDEDVLVFAIHRGDNSPELCCSLRSPMERVTGSVDLWAARFRLAELDRATLTLMPPSPMSGGDGSYGENFVTWRGPEAPPAPPSVPSEEMRGEIVDRTLWSEHLQETRRLLVYLPPDYDPSASYPAIYYADGVGDPRVIEAMILAGEIPPLVVIGMPSGQDGIVEDRTALGVADLRAADYLRGYPNGGGRFAPHLRYVTDELVPWAEREFALIPDRRSRVVAGFSNGATFALWAGLERPEMFAHAVVMSVAFRPVSDEEASAAALLPERTRFFLSAGFYEPSFHSATQWSAEALRAAGFEASFTSHAAGHTFEQWTLAASDALERIFALPPNSANESAPTP